MTNTTEMTITRALAELKLLNDRIYRTVNNATFGGIKVGKKVSAGFSSVEDVEKRAKADYQSVQALIKRRNEIKAAIVVSNATSKVEIAGQTMTVAEAIERKTSIEYEHALLNRLKQTYVGLTRQVDDVNEKVRNRLDSHLETLFGKEGKSSAQANDDIVKAFKSDNEAEFIDPLKLKDKIEELEKSIEDFLLEVDFSLSESNTLNRITVNA
ncbi:hypothetical protein ABE073_04035 [Lederbergia citrisecunda]|uniref:hypothetical protein n=1 Tax=Lederbergia citrisecunda TaxID=2833583 RepID=UPI003D275677